MARAALRWPAHPLVAVGGLLALNAALLLPSSFLAVNPLGRDAGWREPFAFFWLSADVLLMVALLWLGHRLGRRRLAMAVAAGLWLLALTYEAYDQLIVTLFGRPAVLYNDLLLAPDALSLALDLASGWWPVALGAAVALVLAWAVLAVTAVDRGLEPLVRSRRFRWGMVVVAALLLGAQLERGLAARDSVAQGSLVRLGVNLGESVAMAQALGEIQREPGDPGRWRESLGEVRLAGAPPVILIVIESYGSVLWTHPELAAPFAGAREALGQVLRDAGYVAATAFSDSPVTGGMSWLAGSSLLGGLEITDQHLYQRFLAAPLASLPAFFAAQGYSTLAVQPANRERPGRPLGDPYGFDAVLFREELAYDGEPYGWGVVPDQYSVHRAVETALAARSPTFIYIVTVSSHAPWDEVPPLVSDWRRLGEPPVARPGFWARLGERLSRRLGGRGAGAAGPAAFADAMAYELAVLGEALSGLDPDGPLGRALVVVLGDHQPPLFDLQGDASTPVHLFSRDPRVMAAFADFGFVAGLGEDPRGVPHLRHSGIFSLLVHGLAATYGAGAPTPAYLPRGQPLSVLFPRGAQ